MGHASIFNMIYEFRYFYDKESAHEIINLKKYQGAAVYLAHDPILEKRRLERNIYGH